MSRCWREIIESGIAGRLREDQHSAIELVAEERISYMNELLSIQRRQHHLHLPKKKIIAIYSPTAKYGWMLFIIKKRIC